MSMTYPLIHPYGEDGYRVGINTGDFIDKTYKQQKLTMRDFYCFRIQQRLNEGKNLLLASRLLQQYIVDGYVAIEEERFRYIWNNQPKLRDDLYSGLMDAILRGDSDCSLVGKQLSYLHLTPEDLAIGHKIIKMQWQFAGGLDIQICSSLSHAIQSGPK